MIDHGPWDPGLPSERTRLAWVRTAMALAVGGLGAAGITVRAGLPAVDTAAFILAALCGAVLLARTGRRYRRVQNALHDNRALSHEVDGFIAWIGALAIAAGALIFALRM
ncbi:DUF202 domain-containing protein [Sinosporangium siamense]|uniref:DUF202 domain-containing protein n=1 Tax=Sinosporangium siamense TaxID=1367973 RepID=A0A919RF45_9ACTN|nr:DUF202 domain-containing protein [Sinosporangium siamense]GII92232.1 hypothetical protein Ssi02_24630 [Sinosporangium siamense]